MGLIDCQPIVDKIVQSVKPSVSTPECWTKPNKPCLAVVYENDESSLAYLSSLEKYAKRMHVDIRKYSPDRPLNVCDPNHPPNCHGIIDLRAVEYQSKIWPEKQVEGFDCADDIERVSCTARACVEIIESVEEIKGKRCLVIGYGRKVGKPLAYLLMRKHAASVTTVHKYTPKDQVYGFMWEADIIVSAVGKANYWEPSGVPAYDKMFNLRPRVIIDAGYDNGKGDFHEGYQEHNHVSPVPGGVGPVNATLLLKNVWLSADLKF